MSARAGFTLIELLLVCAILAATSYVAWGAYLHVDHRAEDQLARAELLKLATALKRFHDDTGYWPGEGPFEVADACAASGMSGAGIDPGRLPGFAGNGASARRDWLASPANFFLLFEPPPLCNGHPLAHVFQWNPVAHRGWNGPYLPRANRHWVDLDAVRNIPAFAAGPTLPPGGGVAGWRTVPAHADYGYDPATHELARHARPFTYLPPINETAPPRVFYWGPDGRFGGPRPPAAAAPDSDPCLPNTANPDGADDIVICLAATPSSS